MAVDENGNTIPDPVDPNTPVVGPDTPANPDPVTPADPPVDPAPVPDPAPVTHTLGDDLKAIEDAKAEAKADSDDVQAKVDALAAAQDKAKASASLVVDLNAKFAGDIKSSGDAFRVNPDGTATAFYTSTTAPEGYTTEILKPIDTPIVDPSTPAS